MTSPSVDDITTCHELCPCVRACVRPTALQLREGGGQRSDVLRGDFICHQGGKAVTTNKQAIKSHVQASSARPLTTIKVLAPLQTTCPTAFTTLPVLDYYLSYTTTATNTSPTYTTTNITRDACVPISTSFYCIGYSWRVLIPVTDT